jgi:hypothetical protein
MPFNKFAHFARLLPALDLTEGTVSFTGSFSAGAHHLKVTVHRNPQLIALAKSCAEEIRDLTIQDSGERFVAYNFTLEGVDFTVYGERE